MKLFVANLQNPNQSKYISSKEIDSFMLGRRLSNYVVMIVEPMTGFKTVVDISPAQGEVTKIQEIVNKLLQENS